MPGEGALITVLLAVILAAQIALSGSLDLFSRNLWLDEIITDVLVSDRNVLHSLEAITGGLDTNPPAYHLFLRAFRIVVPRNGPATLRIFSTLSVLAALVALYLNLRQVYLPLAAFAAVLAVWSHPLVLTCAVEARMYAPWFAAITWFAYLLSRAWNSGNELWLHLLLASSSFLTCALHTLGAFSLGLVLCAHLLFHHSARWDWRTLGWACVGLVAWLGWIPFLWRQDRAHPATWVSGPTRKSVAGIVRAVLMPQPLATLLVLAGGLSAYLRGPFRTLTTLRDGASSVATLAGLTGLVGLPVGLVALSWAFQPLLVDRYAIPTVASFAPAVAALVAPLSPVWLAVLCGLLLIVSANHLAGLCDAYRMKDQRTDALVHAILRHTGQDPVLFETLHELSVVSYRAESVARRCYVLDFDAGDLVGVDDLRVAMRNQARLLTTGYPCFRLMSWESAQMLPRLYLVASAVGAYGQERVNVEARYPEFRAVPLDAGLYELVRQSALRPS